MLVTGITKIGGQGAQKLVKSINIYKANINEEFPSPFFFLLIIFAPDFIRNVYVYSVYIHNSFKII